MAVPTCSHYTIFHTGCGLKKGLPVSPRTEILMYLLIQSGWASGLGIPSLLCTMPQRYHKAPRRLPPPLIRSVGYFLTNTCIFWNAWKDIYNFRWCWESVEVSERQFKEENNPRCIAQRDCTLLTDRESIAASLLQPDGTRTSQLSTKPPPWKPFFYPST